MEKTSRVLVGVAVLAGIVGAGLAIGWFATRGGPETPVAPPVQEPVIAAQTAAKPPVVNPREPSATQPPLVRTNPPSVSASVAPQPAFPGIVRSNTWETKLDDILVSDTDDTNKVAELFAMFPTLPKDGQEEIAEHLSNLVEDSNYAPLGALLKNPGLDEAVLDVLLDDLLNRPNDVKVPMFLELARTPQHPKAEEALELLELFVDEEYGNDWAKWDQAVKDWLKENPD